MSTFYAPGSWLDQVELAESAAHHAQVKRLAVGDVVRLTSGDGRKGIGAIAELSKKRLVVALESVDVVSRPPHVELLAPVGDRDRMLMLAEKAVELGVSSWRSVVYERSRSVLPRGEGAAFHDKLRLRQISALEQSGGAWLPELHVDTSLSQALVAAVGSDRLLLDQAGESIGRVDGSVALAVGPEGGLTDEERVRFVEAGWKLVSLNTNVLRFETAGIAALAVVRSHLR